MVEDLALAIIIVADTGPILHLHWIGALAWAAPPSQMIAVDAVIHEIEKFAPEALEQVSLLRIANPDSIPQVLWETALDDGERYSLAYALNIETENTIVLLTDDAKARRIAARFHLTATGSIGLLLQSMRQKRLPLDQIRKAVQDLPRAGRLYLSDRVLKQALEEIDRYELELRREELM